MAVIQWDRPLMHLVLHAPTQNWKQVGKRSETAMTTFYAIVYLGQSFGRTNGEQTKPKDISNGYRTELLTAVASRAHGHLSALGRQKRSVVFPFAGPRKARHSAVRWDCHAFPKPGWPGRGTSEPFGPAWYHMRACRGTGTWWNVLRGTPLNMCRGAGDVLWWKCGFLDSRDVPCRIAISGERQGVFQHFLRQTSRVKISR